MIIIALGESIVAVGVGVSGQAIEAGVIVATVLGVALAAGLWWAYFDLVMLAAERRRLWGASLLRGWKYLQLEQDHPPERVAGALPSDPHALRRAPREMLRKALSQLA